MKRNPSNSAKPCWRKRISLLRSNGAAKPTQSLSTWKNWNVTWSFFQFGVHFFNYSLLWNRYHDLPIYKVSRKVYHCSNIWLSHVYGLNKFIKHALRTTTMLLLFIMASQYASTMQFFYFTSVNISINFQ